MERNYRVEPHPAIALATSNIRVFNYLL